MTIMQAEAWLTAMRQTHDAIYAQAMAVWKTDRKRGWELEEKASRLDTAMLKWPEREIATVVPTSLEELAVQLRLLVQYAGDDAPPADDGEEMLVHTMAQNALAFVEGLMASGRIEQ
ncbi:MAG TPA: hypothetical protein VGA46_07805 [Methyloceanibacter sp.]|jgi:hypothetical protein